MTNNSTNALSSSYVELLPKLTNYVVGLTLLCYLAGFAIANMYLGSLGTVNLDVLRTRYILVGFLFLLFLGAIAYLIYGLNQAIHKNVQEPTSKLIINVFWYSLQNLVVLFFAVSATSVLAGLVNTSPAGLPKISQPIPWSDWLNGEPKLLLFKFAGAFVFSIPIFFVVMFIVIWLYAKDENGIRLPRKVVLTGYFSAFKKYALKNIGGMLILFVIVYILLFLFSLLSFLSTTNLSSTTNTLSGGWIRYFGAISLVYIFVTIYSLGMAIYNKSNPGKNAIDLLLDNLIIRSSARIYVVAIVISIIMPLYANGIYPYLPQQVGGGQVIKVELIISDDEIKSFILNPDNEIYLIDRTNNSTIFLLINYTTEKYQVAEIPNSSIQSIIYKPSP